MKLSASESLSYACCHMLNWCIGKQQCRDLSESDMQHDALSISLSNRLKMYAAEGYECHEKFDQHLSQEHKTRVTPTAMPVGLFMNWRTRTDSTLSTDSIDTFCSASFLRTVHSIVEILHRVARVICPWAHDADLHARCNLNFLNHPATTNKQKRIEIMLHQALVELRFSTIPEHYSSNSSDKHNTLNRSSQVAGMLAIFLCYALIPDLRIRRS